MVEGLVGKEFGISSLSHYFDPVKAYKVCREYFEALGTYEGVNALSECNDHLSLEIRLDQISEGISSKRMERHMFHHPQPHMEEDVESSATYGVGIRALEGALA